ncbi:MAG: rhodanese-like domain-containing protein [Candidatus Pacebacteria bacterium]|nr:rhodanese-like domain-containing protein [Candidatus Paceibacterota bacterium]
MKASKKFNNPKLYPLFLSIFVLGVLISSTIIYLTPLKNIALVSPSINDVDPTIFYEDFKENSDDYIFIDVRSPNEYFKAHAEGSINIPIHLLSVEKDRLPRKGKEIVLICTGGALAGVAYHYLEHHGFSNIKRSANGIRGWGDAGLPLVEDSWYSFN